MKPTFQSCHNSPVGLVRTRNGVIFDPSHHIWRFRDAVNNVNFDFNTLPATSIEVRSGFKATCVWYAENCAPGTLQNVFLRVRTFLKRIQPTDHSEICAISHVDLLNYRGCLAPQHAWYMSALASILNRWHALGVPGITDSAVELLREWRLPGNPKGVAILTADPIQGPFTDIEWQSLQAELDAAYEQQKISLEEHVLAWLFMLLGQRPTQYAALKVCDVFIEHGIHDDQQYFLRVPRAKQQGMTTRSEFRMRPLIPQVGGLLVEHANQVRQRLRALFEDPDQIPLFPAPTKGSSTPPFLFHRTASALAEVNDSVLQKLNVRSERVGAVRNFSSRRFRRTVGTRAAAEGHGPAVIADLLDHSDLQNVGVYVEATPEIIERLDRALAIYMAPLAQAFSGVLREGAADSTRGNDPASRISDPRIDKTLKPMGTCGKFDFCGLNAPIACYTCTQFEPWRDGPHEAVLQHLLSERNRLLGHSDARIATINDRSILAVAEVITRCGDAKNSA